MKHKATWNKFSFSFIKKGFRFMFLHLSMKFFITPSLRTLILKSCGITFRNRKSVFIGTDVLFDNLKGTRTVIGENVTITTGTKIINHFPILSSNGVTEYSTGDITIGDNVFIGMNSLIIKPVTIGNGAVIGAGSVVTKDIPEKAIVGGNPAKIIDYIKDS
ncbi:acyltransferase [Winogradskyella sp. A2]|uniref:acyltransferase n=1 Tax=Winogradskyella sp. A2 TaxID=3366944 RepID=UPI00398C622D